MDTSTFTDNTFFLKLSSDSSEGENKHCEFQEFLTTALAPLMTTKHSFGGWTSFQMEGWKVLVLMLLGRMVSKFPFEN